MAPGATVENLKERIVADATAGENAVLSVNNIVVMNNNVVMDSASLLSSYASVLGAIDVNASLIVAARHKEEPDDE